MSVVATSSAAQATAFGNQRKVDRCSNGVLWSMWWGGAAELNFAYSTDDGATWTASGAFGFAGTGANYTPNGSLFIDSDDYLHVAYKDRHSGEIRYRRGTPNAARTAWTWSAPTVVYSTYLFDYPDVVAHPEGTGWRAHIVMSRDSVVHYRRIAIASDQGISFDTALVTLFDTGTGSSWPSIDFHHTGDGKTIAGGTPDLYVAWSAGATGAGKGIRFKKATYAAGDWTWGVEREIDSTRYVRFTTNWLLCMFDGTRIVFPAWINTGSQSDLVLHERDADDTATTPRVLALNTDHTTQISGGSASYDGDGSVHLVGFGSEIGATWADQEIRHLLWDRATDTATYANRGGAFASHPYVSCKRGYSSKRIEWIHTDGTASPYSVTFDSIFLNVPPNAPTLTNPVGGAVIDRTAPQRFAWDFNDPDTGDSQSAYRLYHRLVGASTWTVVEGTTPNTFHDFAAGYFTAGDHEWQVETADAQGEWGPRSASEFFTASTPPGAPTITDPTSGQTIPTETYVVEWSAPSQDGGYEWRRVADNAGSPDTSIVYDGGTSPSTTARSRSVAFPTNNRWEHLQLRIKDGGLLSDWASVRVEVSYTPPPAPSGSTATHTSGAAVDVSGTNPAPVGDEPTVTEMRLYVRSDDDPYRPPEGIRIALGEPVNPTYTDRAVASGVAYEWRWQAIGDNGTSSYSAWFS